MEFNIDFDGTVVTHDFPNIGKNIGAEFVLRKLVENGHNLILFTMRCDNNNYKHSDGTIENDGLTQAVNWFKQHNIPLYGIQRNPTQDEWTSSPKSYAHYCCDDINLGTPLLYIPSISNRKFVNWIKMSEIMFNEDLLTKRDMITCQEKIKSFFKEKHNYLF